MYLNLQFSGALQSWGIKEDWYHTRRTAGSPERAAVAGLIGRAMGIDYEDEEGQKYLLDNVVSVTHISGSGYKRLIDDQVCNIEGYEGFEEITYFPAANGSKRDGFVCQTYSKEYLMGAISKPVVVAVEGSREFLEAAMEALIHPVYPPYLGRACCPPAKCIVQTGEIYETLCV